MHRTSVRRFLTAMLLGFFVTACSATRPADPWKCALVGASIGGLSGVTVGSTVADDDDDTTDDVLIGAGAGAAAGALAGYTICAVMPEGAPPPPPPPPVAAKPAPVVQKTVVLPGVNFGFDRADLSAAAKDTLDEEIVPELRADADLTVLIEGHTDAVGSESYNQALSARRAAAVESYLLGQGIEASRIETRGYGESRPITDNETEIGRAKNRRVEVKEMK